MAITNFNVIHEPRPSQVKRLEAFVNEDLGGAVVNQLQVRRAPRVSQVYDDTTESRRAFSALTETTMAYDIRLDARQLQRLEAEFRAAGRDRELANRYMALEIQQSREAALREQVPALKKAYEEYQLLLALNTPAVTAGGSL